MRKVEYGEKVNPGVVVDELGLPDQYLWLEYEPEVVLQKCTQVGSVPRAGRAREVCRRWGLDADRNAVTNH